ncbi:MAG TPA: preprotein translocase subunit SecG [Candidatus Acidoferrales bacterium]|nr:preprotein translocase subunit SecG [Candidatus Acidoferrum sp.]HEV2299437.1 preprotein translocase subunit SecG [Candidatus Acidoferrales bacterium]
MPWQVKWSIALLAGAGLVVLGWRYSFVLVTLHILVCFLLIFVIMLQSGSAADLAGAFGGAGSQTAFGPRGAATFLTKATTWCAIVFMMSSVALSLKRAPTEVGSGSVLEQTLPAAPAQSKPSAPPANAPATTPTPTPSPQPPVPHK